jgi:hypothetical protein
MPDGKNREQYVGPESIRKGEKMLIVANPNQNDRGRGHSDRLRWHSDIVASLPYEEEVGTTIEFLFEKTSLNSLPGSQESVAIVSNDVCVVPKMRSNSRNSRVLQPFVIRAFSLCPSSLNLPTQLLFIIA